jgi:hypothetical protein
VDGWLVNTGLKGLTGRWRGFRFYVDSRPLCRGLLGLAEGLLLLGQAGASGMSAGIVVSMNQVVMVATQILAAVAAELRSRFATPFLMFL